MSKWSDAPKAMRQHIETREAILAAAPEETLSPEETMALTARAELRGKAARALAALKDFADCAEQVWAVPIGEDLLAATSRALPAIRAAIAKLDWTES